MCEPSKFFISHDRVHNPRCDISPFERVYDMSVSRSWPGARYMFVFENGDLNTAAFSLAEFMQEPFQMFPLATVAVQNTIADDFVDRVRSHFHQLAPHVANHPNFDVTRRIILSSDIKHIVADPKEVPPFASPVLVPNTIHSAFGGGPTGITTMHTFHSFKEAIMDFHDETPPFSAIHVFDESINSVYTLAASINIAQWYVNCIDVNLMPIMPYFSTRKPQSIFHNGYHMETLAIYGKWKIIVFPYSTSFMRPCCCPPGQCRCFVTHSLCCDT